MDSTPQTFHQRVLLQSSEEIDLLKSALSIEMNMLHGYFTFLHQNQSLILRIKP